jgi:hypothetical protein
MAIYGVLRHRATIRRAQKIVMNGDPMNSWATIAADVPCLLDASRAQPEPTYDRDRQTAFNDRAGVLLTSPHTDLLPGDRLTMTRGATGTYVVRPDHPGSVPTLMGMHHMQFAVDQVPA